MKNIVVSLTFLGAVFGYNKLWNHSRKQVHSKFQNKPEEKRHSWTLLSKKSDNDNDVDPLEYANRRKASAWWPFKNSLKVPDYLDGTLAGDLGFDPLGIASNKERLFLFREAETKHARLAMLAAIGWPTSEIVHYELSGESWDTFRAPSVLNGGLDNDMVLFALGLFFAVGAVLEIELDKRKAKDAEDAEKLENFFNMWREDGWDVPGNYGFGEYLTLAMIYYS